MIGRYTRPEMGAIWELQNKFEIWKEIEVLACEAQAELGKSGITKEEAAWIREHANFTVERIDEIEKVTNHDVIAFTTNMAEYIDADLPEGMEPPSRWVHYGMTSSDLGDTALSYQITQAIDIILVDVKQLGETCKRRAFEFQETLCVGRTHGIHAEPMTFGMKFGSWAWALKRAQTRLEEARRVAATGAISGAVGTYSSIDPFVEQYVCEKLGLTPDPLSTQVLARDRHAQVMTALAVTASTLESIAMQVRLLQQSDVIEAEEPFAKGQKGSSAMPHKVNPIDYENSEGNLGIANAILDHLSSKLPVSRLQRDLTDSTVLRNVGVPLAHTLIAFYSTIKGLNKLLLNEPAIYRDLDQMWNVVAEGIQTILRREGYPHPYETLKALTRTNTVINADSIREFIDTLDVSESVKEELRKITPHSYTGF